MRRHLVLAIALAAIALTLTLPANAESWLFRPSTFSHDPVTGDRLNQYARKEPALANTDRTYQQSGYQHMRFGLHAGGSADRLHIVQTWGAGEAIRPYGEWQYPFRAGATPYGPWGNSQGPWTMPYDSWVNPYGQWNRYPYPSWGSRRGGSYPPGQYPGQAPPNQTWPQRPPGAPGPALP